MEESKDELDVFIDFILPLIKQNLGLNHEDYLKEALLDYQEFVEFLGNDWKMDHLSEFERRVIVFKIIQIICSFYTLEVDLDKKVYWKLCYERDFKENTTNEVNSNNDLNEAFVKSMNALDQYSVTLLNLRNVHKASDADIAHLLEIPLNEVEKEFLKAFSLFVAELKKNGVEITD